MSQLKKGKSALTVLQLGSKITPFIMPLTPGLFILMALIIPLGTMIVTNIIDPKMQWAWRPDHWKMQISLLNFFVVIYPFVTAFCLVSGTRNISKRYRYVWMKMELITNKNIATRVFEKNIDKQQLYETAALFVDYLEEYTGCDVNMLANDVKRLTIIREVLNILCLGSMIIGMGVMGFCWGMSHLNFGNNDTAIHLLQMDMWLVGLATVLTNIIIGWTTDQYLHHDIESFRGKLKDEAEEYYKKHKSHIEAINGYNLI